MADYKSKYSRLSFYVKGKRKQFSQGRYSTEDKAEIAALDALTDAQKATEEKAKPKTEQAAQTESAEEKPKPAPKRKPAATTKSTKPKSDKSSEK